SVSHLDWSIQDGSERLAGRLALRVDEIENLQCDGRAGRQFEGRGRSWASGGFWSRFHADCGYVLSGLPLDAPTPLDFDFVRVHAQEPAFGCWASAQSECFRSAYKGQEREKSREDRGPCAEPPGDAKCGAASALTAHQSDRKKFRIACLSATGRAWN